jgi:hypothetical protein
MNVILPLSGIYEHAEFIVDILDFKTTPRSFRIMRVTVNAQWISLRTTKRIPERSLGAK